MLTLHLIRHAKTETTSASGRDHERDLAPKGLSQSNVLGKHIWCQHIDLGEIHVSDANRTRQTISILLQHQTPKPPIILDPSLYHATQQDLFQWVCRQNQPVITIIGHNEGISELATYLLEEDIDMRTAEMVTMNFPVTDWAMVSKGTATLNSRYRPQVYLPESL